MSDAINPSHYKSKKFEVIDVIEEFELNFRTGNTIKYILRAGKKDPSKTIEDLEKALWYLKREIDTLKNKSQQQGLFIDKFPSAPHIIDKDQLRVTCSGGTTESQYVESLRMAVNARAVLDSLRSSGEFNSNKNDENE